MTVQTIDVILKRIEEATWDSPIAVFKEKYHGVKRLNAVFANTVKSQALIADGSASLVGVYSRANVPMIVKTQLERALR